MTAAEALRCECECEVFKRAVDDEDLLVLECYRCGKEYQAGIHPGMVRR